MCARQIDFTEYAVHSGIYRKKINENLVIVTTCKRLTLLVHVNITEIIFTNKEWSENVHVKPGKKIP